MTETVPILVVDDEINIRKLYQSELEELGFKGNTDDYNDPANCYIHEVMNRRTGIPLTLSILFLAACSPADGTAKKPAKKPARKAKKKPPARRKAAKKKSAGRKKTAAKKKTAGRKKPAARKR